MIVDFRPSDTIRMGVAPMYNTFAEIYKTLGSVRKGLEAGAHAEAGPGGRVT